MQTDFRVPNRRLAAPELDDVCRGVRIDILKMLGEAGSGHPGGSLSVVEILVALYMCKMRHDPKNSTWVDRDRFLLSKGHAAPALYAVLSMCGYLPHEELVTLRRINSRLQGHSDTKLAGVEAVGGPEGIGLSEGIGMALAARIDNRKYMTYVLLGDGELDEGEVWEAAMCAAKFKLQNLVAIVDKNGLQQEGATTEIMPSEPVADKWKAFGWDVIQVDGHDVGQILSALDQADKSGVPTVIIAKTVKGKGVDFLEGKVEYHGKVPDKESLKRAIEQLSKRG